MGIGDLGAFLEIAPESKEGCEFDSKVLGKLQSEEGHEAQGAEHGALTDLRR